MVDGNFYCVLTVNTTSGMWMIYIGGPGVVLFGFYFYCYAGLLDRWYGMGDGGGRWRGRNIFNIAKYFWFNLKPCAVWRQQTWIVQKYNEFKINATFLVIINPCSISESFEGHIMQMWLKSTPFYQRPKNLPFCYLAPAKKWRQQTPTVATIHVISI